MSGLTLTAAVVAAISLWLSGILMALAIGAHARGVGHHFAAEEAGKYSADLQRKRRQDEWIAFYDADTFVKLAAATIILTSICALVAVVSS